MVSLVNDGWVDRVVSFDQSLGRLMIRMLWDQVSYQYVGIYSQISLISSGVGQCLTLPCALPRTPYKSDRFFALRFLSRMVSSMASTTISSPGLRPSDSTTSFGMVARMLFPIFCSFTVVAISKDIRVGIYLRVDDAAAWSWAGR